MIKRKTSTAGDSAQNFSQISNAMLRDRRLSFKARGLLAFILTFPDTVNVKMKQFKGLSKDGAAGIRSAIGELEQFGYLKIHKFVEHGRIVRKMEWFEGGDNEA